MAGLGLKGLDPELDQLFVSYENDELFKSQLAHVCAGLTNKTASLEKKVEELLSECPQEVRDSLMVPFKNPSSTEARKEALKQALALNIMPVKTIQEINPSIKAFFDSPQNKKNWEEHSVALSEDIFQSTENPFGEQSNALEASEPSS